MQFPVLIQPPNFIAGFQLSEGISFLSFMQKISRPSRLQMASQAVGEPPNLDVITKGLGIPSSPRPRSHNLACSTRMADLSVQAQAQLECFHAWLHKRKQPQRYFKVSDWK